MKPGYYISESNNLQIWYPFGFFEKGMQTMEVIVKGDKFEQVHYSKEMLDLVTTCFDFDLIEEL
jgi:hypothetical protein